MICPVCSGRMQSISWDNVNWCTSCGAIKFHKADAVNTPAFHEHAAKLFEVTTRYINGKANGDEIERALDNVAKSTGAASIEVG